VSGNRSGRITAQVPFAAPPRRPAAIADRDADIVHPVVTSWTKAVVSYPPTWIAAVVLGATVWLVLTVLDPPGVFVVGPDRAGGHRCRGLAVHDVGHRDAGEAAVRDPPCRGGRPGRDRSAARRTRRAARHPARRTARCVAVEAPEPDQRAERRLDAGELTYARYLATSQQVFSSALDNLHEVAVAYESISTIDEPYIERRLAELAADDSDVESANRERATLERRRELRSTQRRRIAQLLAQNESALTALNRTTTALADVPDRQEARGRRRGDGALEELADRAAKYA
jgi:hypothetical protein